MRCVLATFIICLCHSLLTFSLLIQPTAIDAADWPVFRGGVESTQRGRAEGSGYPKEWSPEQNVAWRFPLPAGGNSSPVVSQGKVFVTCATDDGAKRHLFCLDAKTGQELWKQSVSYNKPEPTHKTNPHCGSSPAVDDDHVVVWHGSAGVFCYSLDGKKLWEHQTGPIHHIWGTGSSPIIDGKIVYLNIGPGEITHMLALSLTDGQTIWKTPEPGGDSGENGPNGEKAEWIGSWSTPQIAIIDGHRQVVCAMPTRVVGYDAETGTPVWWCTGVAKTNGTQLVYTDPLLTKSYAVTLGGFKGPGIGFWLRGEGDITKTARNWRVTKENPQRIGSGVIVGDHIYAPTAGLNGIQCINLESGEVLWTERTPAAFWGSMILADEHIYVTDQSGKTFVIKPDPQKLLTPHQNALNEPSNSTPAFADGTIFLRTYKAVYRITKE